MIVENTMTVHPKNKVGKCSKYLFFAFTKKLYGKPLSGWTTKRGVGVSRGSFHILDTHKTLKKELLLNFLKNIEIN